MAAEREERRGTAGPGVAGQRCRQPAAAPQHLPVTVRQGVRTPPPPHFSAEDQRHQPSASASAREREGWDLGGLSPKRSRPGWRRVGGLDQLLLLLAKVSEDDNIKNALSHAPQPMSPPPPTPSRLASGRTPAPRPTTAAKPAARPAPTPLPPTNDGGGGSPSPSQSAAAPPAGTTPSVSRSLAPLLATPPMAQHEGESPIPSSVSFISKNPVFDDVSPPSPLGNVFPASPASPLLLSREPAVCQVPHAAQ